MDFRVYARYEEYLDYENQLLTEINQLEVIIFFLINCYMCIYSNINIYRHSLQTLIVKSIIWMKRLLLDPSLSL
jgi:hypothetical protein